MTPMDIIDRAVELLRTKGWCQGTGRSDRRLCLMSALGTAAGYEPPNRPVAAMLIRLHDEIERHLFAVGFRATPDGMTAPVQWNDAPGRSLHEVIALLESVRDSWPSEATRVAPLGELLDAPMHLDEFLVQLKNATPSADQAAQRDLVPA